MTKFIKALNRRLDKIVNRELLAGRPRIQCRNAVSAVLVLWEWDLLLEPALVLEQKQPGVSRIGELVVDVDMVVARKRGPVGQHLSWSDFGTPLLSGPCQYLG